MDESSGIERSFAIANRALELMKAYGSSADPRSYEVWFTYVSGHKPLMNDAIKRLASDRGTLADADIARLYEAHLAPSRFQAEAERTGTALLSEIDQVVEMVGLALGSSTKYGASLEAISNDLAGPLDRARIREILKATVAATQEVSSTNRTLEARLKETRGEIETLRETLEAVRVEALTDPLTGIANRKHFEDMLARSIAEAGKKSAPLALAVIDIDHFKRFNDTYGHLTGDQVLRLVGVTMREHVTPGATLARFGGEEFAVILPGATLDAARALGESIRGRVMTRELVKRSTGESLGQVTVSIGVAAFRREDTAMSLLERADQCMFAAKSAGRNRTMTDVDVPQGEWPNVA